MLTAQQARAELASVQTKEQLLSLIRRIDWNTKGSVTVLYSGIAGRFEAQSAGVVRAGEMAVSLLESGNDVRIIDQSEVSKFLNMIDENGNKDNLLADKFDEIFKDDPDRLSGFLYGDTVDGVRIPNSIWDELSARFAAEAVGEVVTITGGASMSRVFFQTELPIILGNPNVTSIDGIPIAAFNGMTVEQAFRVIIAASEERSSRLQIAVDTDGNPLLKRNQYILDARSFFEDSNVINGTAPPPDTPMRSMADFIPPERVAAHREALQDIRKAQDNLAVHYRQDLQAQNGLGTTRWLKALDQLGHIADVVSLAAVAHDAKAAMDAGDQESAERILTQWALENAGAILAGRLASLAVAPLLAAGPLGWLAAGGLILSASMLGSAYADETAEFLAGHLADLWDKGMEAMRDQFQTAERPYSCPLVLDLDRNGVITLAESASGIFFDHDDNGFAERTGWVSSTDGLLVRDLDGNGTIDSGAELFGNHTLLPNGSKAANGFEALRVLDDNGDHFIDHLDSAWNTLKIWLDGNSNGVVDQGELQTFNEAGVLRLGVGYAASSLTDPQGNRHLQIGAFQASDGTMQSMNDVWFRVDQARTKWLRPVLLDEGLASLPDLKGMGSVPDLHQAMASDLSGDLRSILQRWIQGSTVQREALIDPLIFYWVGVSSEQDVSNWNSIDGRLAVMERLLGQTYREGWVDPRPVGASVTMLHKAYEDFRLQLEDQLILQTDGWPILQHFVGPDGAIHSESSSTTLAKVANYLDAHVLQSSDFLKLFRLSRALRSLGDEGELILARIQEYASAQKLPNSIFYQLLSEHQLFRGFAPSNHLQGSVGQDLIIGGAGNDVLSGGSGGDWLVAGRGNDSLNGGIGDAVYVIAQGGDRKQISDLDYTAGNRDVVMFTNVLGADVTQVERHGSQLYLHYGNGDQLWVNNYFVSGAFRVEAFQFADGELWGDVDLRDRAVVGGATSGNDWLGGFTDMVNRIDGLDGDDQLHGGVFDDVLKGGNGNDWLNGNDGDDWLDGGAGNDVLSGGSGRDWMVAGRGNDSLNGGIGDDVYVIAQGGDRKQISDLDYTAGNRDVVMFQNLRSQDVTAVERHGNQLLLRLAGGGQLSVENYFVSEAFRIEAFQFSNGVVWGDRQLRDRVVVGGATAGNDTLGGFTDMVNRIKGLDGNDLLYGGLLNDVLTGGNGNDTLHGGDGDDILDGGSGHDVLYGGRGRDRLLSGTGSDILNGGEGDDTYVIARSGSLKQITDYDPNPANHDTVRFSNLKSTDLISFQRQNLNLEMNFVTKDQLLVSNYFLAKEFRIESFQFSNGITLGESDVFALIPPF